MDYGMLSAGEGSKGHGTVLYRSNSLWKGLQQQSQLPCRYPLSCPLFALNQGPAAQGLDTWRNSIISHLAWSTATHSASSGGRLTQPKDKCEIAEPVRSAAAPLRVA